MGITGLVRLIHLPPMIVFVSLCLSACGNSASTPPQQEPLRIPDLSFRFNFSESDLGWQGGFADVAVNMAGSVNFVADHRLLPAPLNGSALYQSGFNASDDLFMYFKRRINGLEPNRTYQTRLNVTFATSYGQDCSIGVGTSVWTKAGGSTIEPQTITLNEYYRMNINIGMQHNDGANAVLLGDIRNGIPGCPHTNPPYGIKKLSDSRPVNITADAGGSAWLIVGTDSAFEMAHEIYFTEFEALMWAN